MKKAWDWLKRAGAWVAGSLVLLLGALLFWRAYKSKLGRLQDQLAVAEATKELASLKARREEIVREVGERDAAVTLLNGKIENQKRRIVEAYENGRSLTDDEVDDELRRLGIF